MNVQNNAYANKSRHTYILTLEKNFMATFYGWTSNASRLVPLLGGSLIFTTKFPEIQCLNH